MTTTTAIPSTTYDMDVTIVNLPSEMLAKLACEIEPSAWHHGSQLVFPSTVDGHRVRSIVERAYCLAIRSR